MPGPAPLPSSSRRRPFRVLPPLTRGTESLEGSPLLDEVSGDPGLLLWQSLRNVLLWAASPPASRRMLFARSAAARRAAMLERVPLDAALREPLGALSELLRSPAAVPPARVAGACEAISRWAEERGAAATALAFMQAAALSEPTDAARAFAAGRLARLRGEPVRAEGWLHKAVVLGRQNGDWYAYARSYVALGNLAVQRGNFPQARRMHNRALRVAERHRMREVQARVLHDLCLMAIEFGDGAEAVRLAAASLRQYGPAHPRVPYLAHDLAIFWVTQGQFRRALPVLDALLPHFTAASERALILANVAWASGGVGAPDRFSRAADEAAGLVRELEEAPFAAQVLLNVARGASLLGDGSRTVQAAEEAARIARTRMEGKVLASAEALAEAARQDRLGSAAEAGCDAAAAHPADELAAELVGTLAGV